MVSQLQQFSYIVSLTIFNTLLNWLLIKNWLKGTKSHCFTLRNIYVMTWFHAGVYQYKTRICDRIGQIVYLSLCWHWAQEPITLGNYVTGLENGFLHFYTSWWLHIMSSFGPITEEMWRKFTPHTWDICWGQNTIWSTEWFQYSPLVCGYKMIWIIYFVQYFNYSRFNARVLVVWEIFRYLLYIYKHLKTTTVV